MDNVEEIPQDFAWCRDVLHAWMPYNAEVYRKGRRREVHRILQCMRCKTRKRQRMTSEGVYIGSASYTYPEGYLVTGGLKKADRAQLRKINARFFEGKKDTS